METYCSLVSELAARMAAMHTPDTTLPVILNFTLNLDNGELILTVSESVSSTNVIPNRFTLHRFTSALSSDEMYTLTVSTVNPTEDTIQVIAISAVDLNAIKARPLLATSLDTTYLSFTSGAVTDYSNNEIAAVSPSVAILASSFTPDTDRPTLESFELHIGSGQLTMTFSETVNQLSLNTSLITFQSSRNASTAVDYYSDRR